MVAVEKAEARLQNYYSLIRAKEKLKAELMELISEKNEYIERMFPRSELKDVPIFQKGNTSDPTSKAAAKVMDEYDGYIYNKQRLINEKRTEIDDIETAVAIADLTLKEREYITRRYLGCQSVKEVAAGIDLSQATVARLKAKAIEKVAAVMV